VNLGKHALKKPEKDCLEGQLKHKAMSLSVGARVTIHSLTGAPKYNGVTGMIKMFDESKGRWGVKIEWQGRLLSIRPQNLILASSAPATSALGRGGGEGLVEGGNVLLEMMKLHAAHKWRALSAMEGEGMKSAQNLRATKPAWAAAIYSNLGDCYFELGELCASDQDPCNACNGLNYYAKAIELHKQHLAIANDMGDHSGQGTAFGNLGSCYESLGDFDEAITWHEKRLAAAGEAGDVAGQGRAYGALGNCYDSLGKHDKAIRMQKKCLAILEKNE
jgi:hypothetical protein